MTVVAVDGSLRSIGPILWAGMFSNGISMALWLAGAAYLGVTVASVHQNLVPFYVMLIALALGGGIAVHQFWGALLLVVASAVATQLPGILPERAQKAS